MKHSNFKTNVHNLVLAAMFLALALVLPFLTGQIPQIGGMLLPMHLPVFLCGLICGWRYGAVVGFVAPLMRMALFGMPPLVAAVAMAFELAAPSPSSRVRMIVRSGSMKSSSSAVAKLPPVTEMLPEPLLAT